MIRVYKYGFYAFLVASFTLFNVWNISTNRFKNKEEKEHYKNEKRQESLLKSNIILRRKIPEIYGNEIITNKVFKIISKDSSYLVVLLSDFDCAKCQENELKEVYAIKNKLKNYNINILCITKKEKVNKTIVQMRKMNLNLVLYYTSDDEFAKLSFDIQYPQVELIIKGVIASAFLPLAKDYEFSSIYYRELVADLMAEHL